MAPNDHYRAHGRRKVALIARLRSAEAAGVLDVFVRDLALGGAGLELATAPPWLDAGAPVTLEVTAPTRWDPLILSAEVAWLEVPASGVARAGLCFEHHDAGPLYALFQVLGAHAYDA